MTIFQIFRGFWPARGPIFDRGRASRDSEFSGGGDSCIRMHCIKITNGEVSKIRRLGVFEYFQLCVSVSCEYVLRHKTQKTHLLWIYFPYAPQDRRRVHSFPPPRAHVRQH